MVNSLLGRLADALFPNVCCLCQWRCPGRLPLCADCRNELAANARCCRRCALPLASDSLLCGQCLQAPPAFDRVVAPWLYGEYFAYILRRWKFQDDLALTPLMADLWLRSADVTVLPDILLPIPLHWYRQWRRGYNQAELLAGELARALPGLPVDAGRLRRTRATAAQSGMDARQRARNLQGTFTVTGSCDNLRVALVDDVLTTGATAREAASALRQAGAARVDVWCLARTPPPQ
ncbi:ComF family protein [Seongchinamella unica]|uniref:ComF family protein n=1 Tax=Seongchinamella unica TaxID=2547392 RepID=A0A4R5LWQ0_9GAMM|nr:ComF family protein [Seongchinamella unica]TDG15882.1 ComF family protein [Seongchinamella unica]